MKSTTFAVAAMSMASLASARAIHKARQASPSATISAASVSTTEAPVVRNGFELDIFTFKLGVQNLFSREDEFIYVKLAEDDDLLNATVRSVKNDVICTLENKNFDPIRRFGGPFTNPFVRKFGEDLQVGAVGCFFEGESRVDYSDKISGEPEDLPPVGQVDEHEWHAPTENTGKPETQPPNEHVEEPTYHAPIENVQEPEHQSPWENVGEPEWHAPNEGGASRSPFEMDLIYKQTGTRNFFSREEGKIEVDLRTDDILLRAEVRATANNVVCIIEDIDEFQVRRYGGRDQDQSINLEKHEWEKAAGGTVKCNFE